MGFNAAEPVDRVAEFDRAAASGDAVPAGRPSRRTVLLGAGVVGAGAAAAAALAACGSPSAPTQSSSVPAGPLAKTADIPVGGGKIFTSPNVVVTQPTQGTFKAFSSICTHMGCPVTQIANGQITCPCHGSQYSIVDGSVTKGVQPGQAGLTVEPITVANGEISIS